MTNRRVRVELNCQHGRLVEAESHEAVDILRTETAACLQCPVDQGESRYEGVSPRGLDLLAIRRYGMNRAELASYGMTPWAEEAD